MKKIVVMLLATFMLASCGSNYVAKVNDEKISKGEFEFYLETIKEQMKGTELANDEDWQTQEIEGRKAIDVAKDRALEVAVENLAYIEVLDYLDLDLTDAEEREVDSLESTLISQYGGKTNFDAFLKERGIDDDFIEMLCEASVCSEKLAKFALEKYPVTEEERNSKLLEYAGTKYKAKHILIATIDTNTQMKLSDDEIAKKKSFADDLYQKVLEGEDFDTLMNQYSEDPGLATSPDGYIFGVGEMVAEFENTTASLQFGGVAMVESDFGYHIIKRLPITADEIAQSSEMLSEVENLLAVDKLSKAMTEWKQSAGIKIVKNEEVFRQIK